MGVKRIDFMLLVALGGACGTAARATVAGIVPDQGIWPAATIAVNIAGAFLLGLGLEGLARRGDDVGRRRVLRLTVGTGFMGGFTTYSTLALGASTMLVHGHLAAAIVYGFGSVVVGIVAAGFGVWAGAGHHVLVTRHAQRSGARADRRERSQRGEETL